MIFEGMIAALACTDLLIKQRIEKQDDGQFPRTLDKTNGKITIHKFHNYGFPFGFLKEHSKMVKAVPVVIISALTGYFCCLKAQKGRITDKVALTLTLGGALSNLYDRLVRHYVVDYFTIEWKRLKGVIFNLGDIFVFMGAGMYIFKEICIMLKEVCIKKDA